MVNAYATRTNEPQTLTILAALAPIRGLGRANESVEYKTPEEYKKNKDFRDLRSWKVKINVQYLPMGDLACKHLSDPSTKGCSSGNCYLAFYNDDNTITEGTRGKSSMEAPYLWEDFFTLYENYEIAGAGGRIILCFLGDGEAFNPPGFRGEMEDDDESE